MSIQQDSNDHHLEKMVASRQSVSTRSSSATPKRSASAGGRGRARVSVNGKAVKHDEHRWSLKSILAAASLALVALFYALDAMLPHFYVFDPVKLHALTQRAVMTHGNDSAQLFQSILDALQADPKVKRTLNTHKLDDASEWMFNNAGGAMGSMYIIHASITEYLIFFGSPVGTEGHTGRHTADDYFHILVGEQRAYRPGALVPEVYPPGSQHHLRRGTVKQYLMPETGCWALELAQGWIPPMLPFGLADTISSTLDFGTFAKTVYITGREMVGNLIRGKF